MDVIICPSRKHPPHLSSLERPVIILLLTICTKNRKRILACDEMHRLLRAAWDVHDDYPVGRYVIMPEHIHVFIGENNTSFVSVADWVAKWKGYVTRRWRRSSDRPIWQRSFWDRQILGAQAYESKWIYVHLNPVRHGLVKHPGDWPFQGEKVIFRW
jgi:REP-associated tyrosine transposase